MGNELTNEEYSAMCFQPLDEEIIAKFLDDRDFGNYYNLDKLGQFRLEFYQMSEAEQNKADALASDFNLSSKLELAEKLKREVSKSVVDRDEKMITSLIKCLVAYDFAEEFKSLKNIGFPEYAVEREKPECLAIVGRLLCTQDYLEYLYNFAEEKKRY